MAEELGTLLGYIFYTTPQAILIIASYKYLKEGKGRGAKLLLMGSIISLLSSTFGTFFFRIYTFEDFEPINLGWIAGINNFVGMIGMFLFAFGFLLLIKEFLKNRKAAQSEVDQIGKSQ